MNGYSGSRDYSDADLDDGPIIKANDTSYKNILAKLRSMPYRADVLKSAERIWVEIGKPIKKKKERNRLFFFLIFNAHKELGVFYEPGMLSRECGLTSDRDVNKALKGFSPLQSGYVPSNMRRSAEGYLTFYADFLNIHADARAEMNEILETVSGTLGKKLLPQKLAIGVVFFYRGISASELDPELVSKCIHYNKATVDALAEKVKVAYCGQEE